MEFLLKIIVVGDGFTGKTSIIKRYSHGIFSENYKVTLGVDFALKVIQWDEQNVVRIQLWDIAGQERFGSLTRVYYKQAVGALVVFDVNEEQTLAHVEKWKSDIDAKVLLPDGSPIPCVLLANKCDLKKEIDTAKYDKVCSDLKFLKWFETSAKRNTGIDEACKFIVNHILENDLRPAKEKTDLVPNLGDKDKGNQSECMC